MRATCFILALAYLLLQLVNRATAFDHQGCRVVKPHGRCSSILNYHLYNKAFPSGYDLARRGLIWPEGLNASQHFVILIHGYNGNMDRSPNAEIRPELLKVPNVNVVSLEFGALVPDPCYVQSVENARPVSICLARQVRKLLGKAKVSLELLHVIGYGLGAHIAGLASQQLQAETNLRFAHITALDPAKPLYLTKDLSARLDPSDADFVDVIHTDVFMHGILQPLGHVDFYPNMGVTQPSCGPSQNIETHQCYHKRSAEYYAESIFSKTGFWGFYCTELYAFLHNECQPNTRYELLGYYTRSKARGAYFLATNQEYPFARGFNFDNLDRTIRGKTYMTDGFINKISEMGESARNLTKYI